MEGRHLVQTSVRKEKLQQSTIKVIATFFPDCQGILLTDLNEWNTTNNGNIYYEGSLHILCNEIKEKSHEMLRRGFPYIPWECSSFIQLSLLKKQQTNVKELWIPISYHQTPHLAPYNYYKFSKLKFNLWRKRFHYGTFRWQIFTLIFRGI